MKQVRLQSTTLENVVNYMAVVEVKNLDGKLLPGMTASVDFNVETAENVLKLPNAALRFRPTDAMVAQLDSADQALLAGGRRTPGAAGQAAAGAQGQGQGGQGGAARAPQGGGGFPGGGFPGGGARPAGGNGGARPTVATIWYQDATGTLRVARVRSGISDGRETEVESRDTLVKEGLQVISAVVDPGTSTEAVNPFQQSQEQGGPGGFRRTGGF